MERLDNVTILDQLPIDVSDVRVRQLRHDDAEAFAQGTKDSAVREFGHLPLSEYTSSIVREQIDGVIAQGLADGSLAVLAVADRETDDFLGSTVLFDFGADRVEVGFWLTPEARGRSAAVKALRGAAVLAARLGIDRVDAHTSPENHGSRRVLEGAGFEQVGEARERVTSSGAATPVVTFERSVVEFRGGLSAGDTE